MKLHSLLLGIVCLGTALAEKPAPPVDAPADYRHGEVNEQFFGKDASAFWLYEPANPKAKNAPLVIFLHGYSAMDPDLYLDWIEHIVRRGNVVVYPKYQKDLFTHPADYFSNTAIAISDALEILGKPGHTKVDLTRVAVVGHSAGGVGAATYAACAGDHKLPIPGVVMAVHPGQGHRKGWQVIPLGDCTKIPAATHLAVIVGADDGFVGNVSARRIWRDSTHITERVMITVCSDDHGFPELRANHLAPFAYGGDSTNALDWFGYWRTFDSLCDAVFAGEKWEAVTEMGKWSDGEPVNPLKVKR